MRHPLFLHGSGTFQTAQVMLLKFPKQFSLKRCPPDELCFVNKTQVLVFAFRWLYCVSPSSAIRLLISCLARSLV